LTGQAGSGKSVLVNYFRLSFVQQFEDLYSVVICAPTNLAASNINGITFHSLFGLGTNDNSHLENICFDQHLQNINEKTKQILQAMKVLIVDEVSMLDGNHLDFANRFMTWNRREKDMNFGGVNLFAVGDHCQLPPINNNAPFFFQSVTFMKLDLCVAYLKDCHRNHGEFNQFLNLVRNHPDKITEVQLAKMNDFMRNKKDECERKQLLFNVMATQHNNLIKRGCYSHQMSFIQEERRKTIPIEYLNENFNITGSDFVITTQNEQKNEITNLVDSTTKLKSIDNIKKFDDLFKIPAYTITEAALHIMMKKNAKFKNYPAQIYENQRYILTRNIICQKHRLAKNSVVEVLSYDLSNDQLKIKTTTSDVFNIERSIEEMEFGGGTITRKYFPIESSVARTVFKMQSQTVAENEYFGIDNTAISSTLHACSYTMLSRAKIVQQIQLLYPMTKYDFIMHPIIKKFDLLYENSRYSSVVVRFDKTINRNCEVITIEKK
jgi:type II secretory pathway predicted ATPase ExeA